MIGASVNRQNVQPCIPHVRLANEFDTTFEAIFIGHCHGNCITTTGAMLECKVQARRNIEGGLNLLPYIEKPAAVDSCSR